MADFETISFAGQPAPGRKRLISLPRAELHLAQAPDGRWMWGVSYQSAGGSGFAFAPNVKWNLFAADRTEALARAVQDLSTRLQHDAERPPAAVMRWLDSLLARPQPSQLELFALDYPGATA